MRALVVVGNKDGAAGLALYVQYIASLCVLHMYMRASVYRFQCVQHIAICLGSLCKWYVATCIVETLAYNHWQRVLICT